MKTLAIGVLAAVLSSPCFGGGASFPVDVHCIRFDVATYAPIWMSNIWRSDCGSGHRERYEEIWSKFEALGKAGARDGSFSDGLVRIAMRKGRTRIYVDHEMNGLLIDRTGWHFFSIAKQSALAMQIMNTFDGDDFHEKLAPSE